MGPDAMILQSAPYERDRAPQSSSAPSPAEDTAQTLKLPAPSSWPSSPQNWETQVSVVYKPRSL